MSSGPQTRQICSWDNHWREFVRRHGNWWEQVSRDQQAVYTLTHCLIDSLSRQPESKRKPGPFLTEDEAKAEREFLELCATNPETVGVAPGGEPVRYYLGERTDSLCPICPRCPDPPVIPQFEHPEPSRLARKVDRDAIKVLGAIKTEGQEQVLFDRRTQLRYAGYLVQQREYREQLANFCGQWAALRGRFSWNLINGRLNSLPGIVDNLSYLAGDEPDLLQFLEQLCQFATRWYISGFVTWELPIPHGRLRDCPADLILALRGPDVHADYHPPYMLPQARNARVRRSLVSVESADTARADPKPAHSRPLGSEDETIFRMYLLERAVFQRLDSNKRGVVGRLLEAFGDHFSFDERRIKRLRSPLKR